MKNHIFLTVFFIFFVACGDKNQSIIKEIQIKDSVSIQKESSNKVIASHALIKEKDNLNPCKDDLNLLKNLYLTTSFSIRGIGSHSNCNWEIDFENEGYWQFRTDNIIKQKGYFNSSLLNCFNLNNPLKLMKYALKIQNLPRENSCRILLSIDFQNRKDEKQITWKEFNFELNLKII